MTAAVFKKPAAWAVLIFVLALGLRAYRIDLPFVEPYNSISRQATCGSIARNYFRHGFQLFYPEMDENGNGPALFNAELPVNAWLMAITYKLAGGVKEGAARAVSVGFSLMFLYCMYDLVRRRVSPNAAVVALLVCSVSPLSVALSRSIQPDMMMLSLGTAAVYFFYRFLAEGRRRYYLLSAAFYMIAVLVKIHAVHFLAPIVFLSWEKNARVWKDRRLYAYLALTLPAVAWYLLMWHLGRTQDLFYQPYRLISQYAEGAVSASSVFGVQPFAKLAKIFVVHLLSPLGFILLLGNLKRSPRASGDRLFLVWAAAVLFYLVALLPKTQRHPHYQLTLLPAMAYFAAIGWQRIAASGWLKRRFWAGLLLPVLLAAEIFSLGYFYEKLYFIPQNFQNIVTAGKRTSETVPADALVLASYETSPILLYYCDRRGWIFALWKRSDDELIQMLESFREKGAGYFVTSQPERLERVPKFLAHLRQTADVLAEDEDYALYQLRRSGPGNSARAAVSHS